MTSESGDDIFARKLVSIAVLIILYIFIGLFSENKIINPFQPTYYFENLELMVATGAALILGPMIGGMLGGLGYLFLEIIRRILGLTTSPLGVSELVIALGLIAGNWITGFLAREKPEITSKFSSTFVKPKVWYNIIFNTLVSIFGVGIVTNMIIEIFERKSSILSHLTLFLTRFYYTVQLLIFFIPIILILYFALEVFRIKRAEKLDKLYHQLDIDINENGPAVIEDVSFKKRAFQVGKWTAIDITFKHTWNASRSYDIETVSTSKIYPHRDKTSVLNNGDTWTHTCYVQPLEQDHVDIRARIHPAHTIKYKENLSQQTELFISGKTYVQRDYLLIAVFLFSEVIISLFLFSLLWNKLATIVISEIFGSETAPETINTFTVPWELLIVVITIELLLFLPFLLMMYYIQKPRLPDHMDNVLAFSQDTRTHTYKNLEEHGSKRKAVLSFFFYFIINLILVSLTIGITYKLFITSQNLVQTGSLDQSLPALIGLVTLVILSWIITFIVLDNTTGFIKFKENISVDSGTFISKIKTMSQLKIHSPSDILVEVRNNSRTPGLRIVFESNDAISPPMIELHIDKNEIASFKLSITPQARGKQEILAVLYPLFDENSNYIEPEDGRPIANQNITYSVLGETVFGITNNQGRTLRHIFGWGSLLTTTIALANQYVGIEEAIRQWQQTIPFLATIQIPFLYLYYLFSNRFLTNIEAY